MIQGSFFCSEMSQRVSEKTFGTASTGDVWFLLEYPRAWGPHALRDSSLAAPVKVHLNRALKAIPRSKLLFIKQEKPKHETFSLLTVRCRESDPVVARLALRSYEELLDIDLSALASSASATRADIWGEPLFLVCTHGRRDKCCAKFGYPLYRELKAYAGDAVWQSSHVGGDRFAANIISFPHGLFNGHVTIAGGKRIVDEYRAGKLVLDDFRGRACYSYPAQAAEFFIRQESGMTAIDALRLASVEREGPSSHRVSFASAINGMRYDATVVARQAEFQTYQTCHATEFVSPFEFVLTDYRTHALPDLP